MLINMNDYLKTDFDMIIDARSPKEFEESHIPGSINLYVLNNEEHHEIGYLYKQVSKKAANKKGVIYILKNIASHLENNEFENKKILIYCARGGKRSESFYVILRQLGFDVYKLNRGYKAYRKYVSGYLQNIPNNFLVLRGPSGCGKSELIQNSSHSLDLEKLANHYGSSFGSRGKQPSQKMFENLIFEKLRKVDKNDYVFVEAESSRLGNLLLPGNLTKKIKTSPQIEINAPLEDRIKRILKYYGDIDKNAFSENLNKIKKYISNESYNEIFSSFEKGNLEKVAKILLVDYYDKVYKKKESDYFILNTDIETTLKKLKEIKEKFVKIF
jgi:tRNA 2-selenouridine synthase